MARTPILVLFAGCFPYVIEAAEPVPRYGIVEAVCEHAGEYANPYLEQTAIATIADPTGREWTIPLFWDGGRTWKLRFSPDVPGEWRWQTSSGDHGLDGRAGAVEVIESGRPGGLVVMKDHPHHFARQNGEPFWFLGDTAWALFCDREQERLDRTAVLHYLRTRAGQGFNVVHTSLLSEAGWGNAGGAPFHDIANETINPAYWQEVEERVRAANALGLTVGLALAWGEKGRGEPYAWRKFPSDAARERYARYAAARFAAYDVYFLVAGEWHAEYSAHRGDSNEGTVRERFVRLGRVLDEADPHGRMIAIHPMTDEGSVREFFKTGWMAFGDYQQNYADLHARALASRKNAGPVVNSEYGYHLRDQNGDGTPDKDNSTSTEAMRHATWDILMAGGYVVTGFGGTYFGGNRDPGPFDVEAERHDDWEAQIGHAKSLFESLEWWTLAPADDLLTCETPRGRDEKELGRTRPPRRTYWCLADERKTLVVYIRGTTDIVKLDLGGDGMALYRGRWFDPRTGVWSEPEEHRDGGKLFFDRRDEGVYVLTRIDP